MSRRFERLVLHIGQHKTGTTSLQAALARSRRSLRAAGVLYPRLPGWRTAHHALAPALLGPEHCAPYVLARLGGNVSKAVDRSRRALETLSAVASMPDLHTLVLSSEAFFRALPAERIDQLAAQLDALADEIRIVCYVREPVGFYLSSLNTLIQAMRPIQPPWPGNRRAALEAYGGAARFDLAVRPFDGSQGSSGIVENFARHIPGGANTLSGSQLRRLNQSLSSEALSMLLEYSQRTGGDRHGVLGRRDLLIREAVRQLDRLVPGHTRPSLLPGVAEDVLRASADIHWLRDVHGCVFPSLDYSIAGAGGARDFGAVSRIEDICSVDDGRRARLALPLRLLWPAFD